MIALIFVQLGYLGLLNKQHRKRRVRNRKSEGLVDLSMQKQLNIDGGKQQQRVALATYQDLTDRENGRVCLHLLTKLVVGTEF